MNPHPVQPNTSISDLPYPEHEPSQQAGQSRQTIENVSRQNPFEVYRHPETGRWVVLRPSDER